MGSISLPWYTEMKITAALHNKAETDLRVWTAFSHAVAPGSQGKFDLRRIPLRADRLQQAINFVDNAPTGTIKRLHMAHCEITKFPGSFATLRGFLETTSVPFLDFSYNIIPGEELGRLVETLKHNPKIQELRMRNMNIEGIVGGECLASLVGSTSLCSLDISKNRRLGIEGAQELANGLKNNTSLEELNLNDCRLGDEATALVVEALVGHPKLRKLVLSRNQLSLASLRATARLLNCCGSRLESLDLSCNPDLFGEIVYAAELDNVEGDEEQKEAEVQDRVNSEQEAAGCVFSMALKDHKTLIDLDLSYCDTCGEIAVPLFGALGGNCSIQVLDVTCNRLGRVGYQALFDCVARMKELKKISFNICDALVDKFLDALACSQSLLNVENSTPFPFFHHMHESMRCCLRKNKALKHIRANSDKPLAYWVPVMDHVVGSTWDPAIQSSVMYQMVRELAPVLLQNHQNTKDCPET